MLTEHITQQDGFSAILCTPLNVFECHFLKAVGEREVLSSRFESTLAYKDIDVAAKQVSTCQPAEVKKRLLCVNT